MTPATLPAEYADAHAEIDRDEGEENENAMSIEDDERWCTVCGKDADACNCDIGPILNNPDESGWQEPEMEMPTPCRCGEIFDLLDGKPCHKCHTVFCPNCSRDTDDGWRCYQCKPENSATRSR